MVVTRPTTPVSDHRHAADLFAGHQMRDIFNRRVGRGRESRFFITSLIGTLLSSADLLFCLRPKICAAPRR